MLSAGWGLPFPPVMTGSPLVGQEYRYANMRKIFHRAGCPGIIAAHAVVCVIVEGMIQLKQQPQNEDLNSQLCVAYNCIKAVMQKQVQKLNNCLNNKWVNRVKLPLGGELPGVQLPPTEATGASGNLGGGLRGGLGGRGRQGCWGGLRIARDGTQYGSLWEGWASP